MKTTLRIPAKSTQISEGHLGYGVDILAQVRLDTLADALNAMEHDDLDPGERPMNADQCRDALLRELLGGWSPSELVEAKIPGVMELWEQLNVARACQRLQADEIATLRRERDEACVWGIIEDGRDEDRSWATGCGEEMIIIEGTPLENDYRFCPCCGRKLQIDTTPTPGAQA